MVEWTLSVVQWHLDIDLAMADSMCCLTQMCQSLAAPPLPSSGYSPYHR